MPLDPKVLSDLIEINMAEIAPQFEEGETSPKIAYTAFSNAIVQFLPEAISDATSEEEEELRDYKVEVDDNFSRIKERLDYLEAGGSGNSGSGGNSDTSALSAQIYNLTTLINELNQRLIAVENKEGIYTYIQSTKEGEGR